VREVDRRAVREDWDEVVALRDACLIATEETGRQLWGPARYAAYRVALDGPAPLAASMIEPGVVRFGLGPLTEVVTQRHTFDELAAHLDATLLPVVAQERVLRGEDLRGDPRAGGDPDDPPLVLQPFEPAYVLSEYRASERLDGVVPDPAEAAGGTWRPLTMVDPVSASPDPDHDHDHDHDHDRDPLVRALEDVVTPWTTQSSGDVRIASVRGDAARAVCAALVAGDGEDPSGTGEVRIGAIGTATFLQLVAFAGASGGVHGRRRGGAAGRALAWWVARCATGLHRQPEVDPEELEFRMEDLELLAFRVPGEAAWRLEVALGSRSEDPREEWGVAIAAFDRSEAGPEVGPAPDPAPW
jgi:hypothetical protein